LTETAAKEITHQQEDHDSDASNGAGDQGMGDDD